MGCESSLSGIIISEPLMRLPTPAVVSVASTIEPEVVTATVLNPLNESVPGTNMLMLLKNDSVGVRPLSAFS